MILTPGYCSICHERATAVCTKDTHWRVCARHELSAGANYLLPLNFATLNRMTPGEAATIYREKRIAKEKKNNDARTDRGH